MASEALYRKWRSQTFDELVGQEHVVQTLRHAIQTGRIGHAYLFTGPRGVGKTTMARLLAKAVNCEAPQEQRPCNRCELCQAITEGRAVDVIEMDAASHTSVEDAREIIERIQFRPTSARVKVYVIDEVHMLSNAAFNALLKTLEEPPPHALFILATTELHKVPATIISRCQRFVFQRHSVANIAAHLERIAAAEGVTLEPGVAGRIARAATGAMRDAISILDQLIAGSAGRITLAQVQDLLGAADTSQVGALVNALLDGDVQAALQAITTTADSGADLRQFARDLVERLRGLLLLSVTNDTTTLDVPDDVLAEMKSQAARADAARLVAWLKLFANLDYQLRTSAYGQLPLELAVVEALVAPQPASADPPRASGPPQPAAVTPKRLAPPPGVRQAAETPPATPGPATHASEAAPETAPVPASAPPAPAATANTPEQVIQVADDAVFLLADVEAVWDQVKEDIRAIDKLIYAQLDGVVPINVEDRTVVLLATKGEWQKKKLEVERTRKRIERELTRALGSPCFYRVTIDQQEEMPDLQKQIQQIRRDELVRSAINIFDATIIAVDKL